MATMMTLKANVLAAKYGYGYLASKSDEKLAKELGCTAEMVRLARQQAQHMNSEQAKAILSK